MQRQDKSTESGVHTWAVVLRPINVTNPAVLLIEHAAEKKIKNVFRSTGAYAKEFKVGRVCSRTSGKKKGC